MAKMIQIRNVPDALHGELVRRAKARRQTLTRYLQEILEREASRPPADEIVERVEGRSPVDLGKTAAEMLREERRERGLG
jgi:hypothetical protein